MQANVHDLRLPDWGPYSKTHAGISHIADSSRGIRVDFMLVPGLFLRLAAVPSALHDTNVHMWDANPQLARYLVRHELRWKDRIFADIAYDLRHGGPAITARFVNNTDAPIHTMLNLLVTVGYPNEEQRTARPLVPYRAELPESAILLDAVGDARLFRHDAEVGAGMGPDALWPCERRAGGMARRRGGIRVLTAAHACSGPHQCRLSHTDPLRLCETLDARQVVGQSLHLGFRVHRAGAAGDRYRTRRGLPFGVSDRGRGGRLPAVSPPRDPLPIQIVVARELWNRHSDIAQLRRLYPGLTRMGRLPGAALRSSARSDRFRGAGGHDGHSHTLREAPYELCLIARAGRRIRRDGYWNGAVWIPHQWLLWKSLIDYGRFDLVVRIARTALELRERESGDSYNGYEHFIIETGRGAGSHQFGGLTTPVPALFNALYRVGRVTPGYDVRIDGSSYDYAADSATISAVNERVETRWILLSMARDAARSVRSRGWRGGSKPRLSALGDGIYGIGLPGGFRGDIETTLLHRKPQKEGREGRGARIGQQLSNPARWRRRRVYSFSLTAAHPPATITSPRGRRFCILEQAAA